MVRNLSVFLLLLWFVTSPAASWAAEEETRNEIDSVLAKNEITLSDLFRLAELTNPTLAAAESGVQAKAGQAQQAGLYPNPTIGFEVEEVSTNDPGDRKDKLSIVQPLILSGRRGAAVDAARAEQAAAGYEFKSARREVFRRIHVLWAEQLYFREAAGAFDELLSVANHTLEIARIRFEARAAPESQVDKALLEVYELEVAQRQLVQEQVVGAAELRALFWGVDVPFDRLVDTLDQSGFPKNENLGPGALEGHPAFQAAQRELEAAEASLREAKASRFPDIGIYLAYGRNRSIDEGFVEAGVSLPLPIFNRNQGRVAESQFQIAQAQSRGRIVNNHLVATLTAANQRYLTAADQLDATRERMLPAAQRGLSQAQEGYRVGHLPFLELIDAQRTLSTVLLRTLELQFEIVVAEANLMSLVGASPYGENEANHE